MSLTSWKGLVRVNALAFVYRPRWSASRLPSQLSSNIIAGRIFFPMRALPSSRILRDCVVPLLFLIPKVFAIPRTAIVPTGPELFVGFRFF